MALTFEGGFRLRAVRRDVAGRRLLPTRCGRWVLRGRSRRAVGLPFKPWARLGIVERLPPNGQVNQAGSTARTWYWPTRTPLLGDAGRRQRDVYPTPLPAGGVSRIRCDIGKISLSSLQLTRADTPATSNCVTLYQ